jgi:hypothetical protein
VTAGNANGLAMLAGRWAQLQSNNLGIGVLPWAPSDPDLYFYGSQVTNNNMGPRIVLPVSMATCICSLYYAVSHLPSSLHACIAAFCDSTNTIQCVVMAETTGAISVYNNTGTLLSQSGGPVLPAESAAHVEILVTPSTGAVTVQVNGTTVVNASGLAFTGSGNVAQLRFMDGLIVGFGDSSTVVYVGNLIVRDALGSVNNGITGDRRVATMFVDANDPANQGWTPRPLQRFGTGILDLTNNANSSGQTSVYTGADQKMYPGAGAYTIEGQFRFQALPTGAAKSVLFQCWDETANTRSYQLYVGGPSLESGNTVFRISTDGTATTINELISWPFQWQVGEWYHVAVTRDVSNNTRLFINGVQQSITVSDANTYFSPASAGPYGQLGGAYSSSGGAVANSGLDGWIDEFRLTIGICRYNATFSPPVAAFPRGGYDTFWAYVVWLSGFDTGSILDESSYARALNVSAGAVAVTPNDGSAAYQVINKNSPPLDNTFIEAALIAATGTLTYTALPTVGKIVTLGATAYTWVSALTAANQVLVGATIVGSMNNLAAAVNAGPGSGTVYGSGTPANTSADASVEISGQILAAALTPGAGGNTVATTTNDPNASWTGATLSGGLSIPGYSQFYYSRLLSNVTTVDSVTILSRSWKTDAGACAVQASFVGAGGGVETGANNSITTSPTFYSDTFETDPDTSGAITPTTVLLGCIRINRTT